MVPASSTGGSGAELFRDQRKCDHGLLPAEGRETRILPESYRAYGLKAFQGICDRYLKEKDGHLSLGGICLVAGLGPEDNRRRDGSFEYYMSEPIVEDDAKGVGPLLLAYTEMRRLDG